MILITLATMKKLVLLLYLVMPKPQTPSHKPNCNRNGPKLVPILLCVQGTSRPHRLSRRLAAAISYWGGSSRVQGNMQGLGLVGNKEICQLGII